MEAFPDDPDSDESDEWDAQESEEEWEDCVGDAMYRDYRRMQRGTFLIAHIRRREEAVRREMGRWMRLMEKLGACKVQRHITSDSGAGGEGAREGTEEFGLDCHDLSLENVFVDEKDHTKITCVIDWESTTTRPLWACAHLPAFVQSSPFTVRLFRETVAAIATGHSSSSSHSGPSLSNTIPPSSSTNPPSLAALASEWLYYESWGARLRHAHRCVEWDGWEEGLVNSILGSEETEDEWFKEGCGCDEDDDKVRDGNGEGCATCVEEDASERGVRRRNTQQNVETALMHPYSRRSSFSALALTCVPVAATTTTTVEPLSVSVAPAEPIPLPASSSLLSSSSALASATITTTSDVPSTAAPQTISRPTTPSAALRVQRRQAGRLILKKEKELEQTLVSGGDICGGRGGELGRRLEEVVRRRGLLSGVNGPAEDGERNGN